MIQSQMEQERNWIFEMIKLIILFPKKKMKNKYRDEKLPPKHKTKN